LHAIEAGHSFVVDSIDDRRPQTVRRLATLGILPGVQARVDAVTRAGVRLIIGRRSVTIPARAALAVHCKLLAQKDVA
jgi:Fe2+ transport system protein FeoA